MPDWLKEILGYGPLGAFAVAVCWGVWTAVKHGGPKLYALGERYVLSNEQLHDTLKASMDKQQTLCDKHGLVIMAHDEAMRKAALRGCKFCRDFIHSEHPTFSATADQACDEIERIIQEP